MTKSRDEARAVAQVRDSLRQWGRQPVPLQSPDLARDRAERGIATLAAALSKAQQQRQRRARVHMVALVAAGLVCSLLGAKALFGDADASLAQAPPKNVHVSQGAHDRVEEAHARGRLTLHRDGASHVVDGIASLRAGDVVETTDGSGQVNLQRVTRADLSPATKLAIAVARPDEQTLRLRQGTASFQVDPSRQARVVVETDDARVVVTGTRFAVTADADTAGSWTSVEVTSGSVLVESEGQSVRLGPGNSWSSRTQARKASEARLVDTTPKAPSPSSVSVSASGLAKESPAPTTASLAEENGLLQAALSARRQGSGARCVALLDQLVTRHPGSPLRQEAVVLRFRCLRDGGDLAQARRAAARYLADYPNGFAKDEALALMLDR